MFFFEVILYENAAETGFELLEIPGKETVIPEAAEGTAPKQEADVLIYGAFIFEMLPEKLSFPKSKFAGTPQISPNRNCAPQENSS